jgi:DNA-binding CsgD family transcriptional regulator
MAEPEAPQDDLTLAQVLRLIRQRRGLRAADAAKAMGLPLRTYLNFEADLSGASPARLLAFAEAADCDGMALILCAGGADPALALACADNKAASIAMGAVDDLYQSLGAELSTLTAAAVVGAFDRASTLLKDDAFARSRGRAEEAFHPQALLTPRQLECLRWAQAGKSSNDIGVILEISNRTVDSHIKEACARLEVRTRVQAISRAIELGLLAPRPR